MSDLPCPHLDAFQSLGRWTDPDDIWECPDCGVRRLTREEVHAAWRDAGWDGFSVEGPERLRADAGRTPDGR